MSSEFSPSGPGIAPQSVELIGKRLEVPKDYRTTHAPIFATTSPSMPA